MTLHPLSRICPLTAGLAVLFLPAVLAQRRPHTAWRKYGGGSDSMRYSALRRIDNANVSRLELAWFYPVPTARFEFNSVVVDRVRYGRTGRVFDNIGAESIRLEAR